MTHFHYVIGGNDIGDEGAIALGSMLENNKELLAIDASKSSRLSV